MSHTQMLVGAVAVLDLIQFIAILVHGMP